METERAAATRAVEELVAVNMRMFSNGVAQGMVSGGSVVVGSGGGGGGLSPSDIMGPTSFISPLKGTSPLLAALSLAQSSLQNPMNFSGSGPAQMPVLGPMSGQGGRGGGRRYSDRNSGRGVGLESSAAYSPVLAQSRMPSVLAPTQGSLQQPLDPMMVLLHSVDNSARVSHPLYEQLPRETTTDTLLHIPGVAPELPLGLGYDPSSQVQSNHLRGGKVNDLTASQTLQNSGKASHMDVDSDSRLSPSLPSAPARNENCLDAAKSLIRRTLRQASSTSAAAAVDSNTIASSSSSSSSSASSFPSSTCTSTSEPVVTQNTFSTSSSGPRKSTGASDSQANVNSIPASVSQRERPSQFTFDMHPEDAKDKMFVLTVMVLLMCGNIPQTGTEIAEVIEADSALSSQFEDESFSLKRVSRNVGICVSNHMERCVETSRQSIVFRIKESKGIRYQLSMPGVPTPKWVDIHQTVDSMADGSGDETDSVQQSMSVDRRKPEQSVGPPPLGVATTSAAASNAPVTKIKRKVIQIDSSDRDLSAAESIAADSDAFVSDFGTMRKSGVGKRDLDSDSQRQRKKTTSSAGPLSNIDADRLSPSRNGASGPKRKKAHRASDDNASASVKNRAEDLPPSTKANGGKAGKKSLSPKKKSKFDGGVNTSNSNDGVSAEASENQAKRKRARGEDGNEHTGMDDENSDDDFQPTRTKPAARKVPLASAAKNVSVTLTSGRKRAKASNDIKKAEALAAATEIVLAAKPKKARRPSVSEASYSADSDAESESERGSSSDDEGDDDVVLTDDDSEQSPFPGELFFFSRDHAVKDQYRPPPGVDYVFQLKDCLHKRYERFEKCFHCANEPDRTRSDECIFANFRVFDIVETRPDGSRVGKNRRHFVPLAARSSEPRSEGYQTERGRKNIAGVSMSPGGAQDDNDDDKRGRRRSGRRPRNSGIAEAAAADDALPQPPTPPPENVASAAAVVGDLAAATVIAVDKLKKKRGRPSVLSPVETEPDSRGSAIVAPSDPMVIDSADVDEDAADPLYDDRVIDLRRSDGPDDDIKRRQMLLGGLKSDGGGGGGGSDRFHFHKVQIVDIRPAAVLDVGGGVGGGAAAAAPSNGRWRVEGYLMEEVMDVDEDVDIIN